MRSSTPWCIEWQADLRKLFREYVAAKQRQNVLDYDDLLLCWAENDERSRGAKAECSSVNLVKTSDHEHGGADADG
jgi:hypothetical protein